MLANAKTPTFASFPDDELAAPDVYGLKNSSGTINAGSGISDPSDLSAKTKSLLGSSVKPITADQLSKYKLEGGSISSMLSKIDPPKVATDTSRASNVLGGGTVSSLRNLTGNAASLLSKALTVTAPIIAQSGGVNRMISGVKAGDANVLANIINGITKSPASNVSFRDPSATVNSVVGMVSTATKVGIPNVLPNVLSSVATGKGDMSAITKQLLPVAAKASDLPMLNTLASNNKQGAIVGMAPGVLNKVSASFKKPEETKYIPPALPVTTMQNISSTFTATDVNWNFASRNNVQVPNVSIIASGNTEFKEAITNGAIASNNSLDKDLLLGTMFPSTSNTSAALAAANPHIPIGPQ